MYPDIVNIKAICLCDLHGNQNKKHVCNSIWDPS